MKSTNIYLRSGQLSKCLEHEPPPSEISLCQLYRSLQDEFTHKCLSMSVTINVPNDEDVSPLLSTILKDLKSVHARISHSSLDHSSKILLREILELGNSLKKYV